MEVLKRLPISFHGLKARRCQHPLNIVGYSIFRRLGPLLHATGCKQRLGCQRGRSNCSSEPDFLLASVIDSLLWAPTRATHPRLICISRVLHAIKRAALGLRSSAIDWT
jgi:hypothetical protein